MGISGQIGAANYRILDARYALMNCLSVSAAGELYQGRDLERLDRSGAESRVLIHIMPTNWSAVFNAKAAFQDLCVDVQALKSERVLAVLDHGSYGATHYFVLESPTERNLMALAKVTTDFPRIQTKALNWLDSLQAVRKVGLEPGLLLLTPNEDFYVTATNLLAGLGQDPHFGNINMPLFQQKQANFTGRQLGFAGLLSLGAMAAAASVATWYKHEVTDTSISQPQAVRTSSAASAVATVPAAPMAVRSFEPVEQVILADAPLYTLPEPVALSASTVQSSMFALDRGNAKAIPTATDVPKSKSKLASAADKSESSKLEVAAKHAMQAALQPKTRTKSEKPTPEVKAAKPDLAQKQAKTEPPRKMATLANRQPDVQVQDTIQPPAKMVANTTLGESNSEIDSVIQAAYAALAQGDLGGGRGGALYYLRQLRDLHRLHPQIKRLAREIASHYHGNVRNLLAEGRGGDALPTLRAAKSVIMEFNLAEMNSAHDVLLHKVGSF